MSEAAIAVANAPVSYGAFELTVGHDPDVPDGITVLDQVAAAGYAGIDLGPVGYLGRGERLGELLAERGLGLAGAYVELPYADHEALERALPELDAILDAFDAVRPYIPGPPPRPTLADNGSQERRNHPGRSVRDHSLGFDADAWRRFAAGLARVIERCRDRGYEPTFHPETGTHVEAPWEIERVLEVSDVGLCLETGHMLLGGGDPVAMLTGLGDRVNHVHLKDARLPVMARIIRWAATSGWATRCGPRRSAPGGTSGATSSTRPRARPPSSRRCVGRRGASPRTRPARARARAPRPVTRSRRWPLPSRSRPPSRP
jgi:inosose dehydratase